MFFFEIGQNFGLGVVRSVRPIYSYLLQGPCFVTEEKDLPS